LVAPARAAGVAGTEGRRRTGVAGTVGRSAAKAREGSHRRHAGAARGAGEHLVRDGPLHGRADEDRGELDAGRAAARAAAVATGVIVVVVVLVVAAPVDAVEDAVIAAEGIVVIVPEALQAFFLARHVEVAFGEDVPPRLVAAVMAAAPIRVGIAGRQSHAHE